MGSDDDEFGKINLGSRCEWHPETVSRLLQIYGDKCSHGKGYLKTKDWEDIVKYVNIEAPKTPKTMKQCREKIDSLKRRYKVEKRKAELRNSTHVDWSFFLKLDEIMSKNAALQPPHSFDLVDPLDFDDAFENHHGSNFLCNGSGSNGNIYNHYGNSHHSNRFGVIVAEEAAAEKGKGLVDNADGLCDVVLNAVGYENCLEIFSDGQNNNSNKRRRAAKAAGFERIGGKGLKRAVPGEKNPVQALADALVGFSEVYSRIEVAKMELLSKMNLELAKLSKRRRKNGEGYESGFSSCSLVSSSAASSSDSEGE